MNDFRKIRVIYNPLGELPSPIQEILAFCPQCSGVGKSSLVSSVFNIDKKITDVQHQQAGTADIEREITFSSNDCFILYDSQGFEPGSDESLSTATKFISDRCDDSKELKDRLHAIW
ncbi:hypothetical protein K435DRAFT_646460 [Dendrothele bispora CBS 962.96]|uniref:G domain-containing protein n=1 Tax=Dendrothele bispora (strain CBS 962.96) TaxID=1314807 RepID=A0A4S8MT66_DENBC|nr:hypothetical protein K435DRAFT_646460 [Dendrothele bispora CBS 962.96]